ncbi:hypothetical protein [Clostridium saccharoperbutylacetonicum]|jgi:hypothetical protein|nr:hypothetical protein [Clostridium saccharoperbutylacetonicum]
MEELLYSQMSKCYGFIYVYADDLGNGTYKRSKKKSSLLLDFIFRV